MTTVDSVLAEPAGGDSQGQGITAVMLRTAAGLHDLITLELGQRQLTQTAGFQKLRPGEPQWRLGRWLRRRAGRCRSGGLCHREWRFQRRGRLPSIHRLEMFANDLERQVVTTLDRKHVSQALDVGIGVAPIPRWGALWADQALRLQESDLGNGDVRKVVLQQSKDMPNTARV